MSRRGNYNRRRDKGFGNLFGIATIILLIGGGLYLVKSQIGNKNNPLGIDIGAKIGGVLNAPVDMAHNGFSYISSIFTNAEEVRRLRRENQALLEWRDGARAIAEKLETYEKLNNIAGAGDTKMLTGRVVSETNGPFAKSAIVNLGSNHGIAANWVAVNQYGLVGRVVSVGRDSARILLLNDGDSRIPVMGEKTRGRAMLIGDKTDAPRIEHLNIPSLIAKGERLLSSGDDGIIPRGITIGIADIAPDGKWRVKLSTSGNAVDYVKLIAPNYIPIPNDKTNGIEANGAISFDASDARATPYGAIMPLNDGAAQIPLNATPEAIAQAQKLRKIQAQLEATKKTLEASKKTSALPKAQTDLNANANPVPIVKDEQKPIEPKQKEAPPLKTDANPQIPTKNNEN